MIKVVFRLKSYFYLYKYTYLYLLEINLNLILAGIYSSLCQAIPCQFAKFFKFLWPVLRHSNNFLPCRFKVSFSSVLNTAAVSRYPGGCRLSVHWSYCHRCGDNSECPLSSHNLICRCTISNVKAFLRRFRKKNHEKLLLTLSCLSIRLPALHTCPSVLLEVRHPRCVGSITKNFVYYTYSQTQLYFIY